MDSKEKIHIVYRSRDNKIIHLNGEDSTFARNMVLEDKNNTYQINNIKVIAKDNTAFLFYVANNPYENTTDLIFHDLSSNGTPQALLSLTGINASYSLEAKNNELYLLCINKNEEYELNLYSFLLDKREWHFEYNVTKQTTPIIQCHCCLDTDSTFHFIYSCEQFGQHQLYYCNSGNLSNNKFIYSCTYALEPIIFKYKHMLWINWLENKSNKMSFSSDNGLNFSNALNPSLQSDRLELIYLTSNAKLLSGNKFYGITTPTPIISILNHIDIDNTFTPDNYSNELNIMIKSLQTPTITTPTNALSLEEEIKMLKEVQENIKEQYETLSNFAKELQDEGKKWRAKYLRAEADLRKYKESKKTST